MSATRSTDGRRHGVALVMVLWIMTILAAVALEISLMSRLRLQATRNTGDGVKAFFLARAGVERAVADLKAEREMEELEEGQEQEFEDVYREVEVGPGTFTLLAEPAGFTRLEPEYGIADESARLNLNEVDEEVLRRMSGIEPGLLADILLLRQEMEELHGVGDLLLIERMDAVQLYGEDQNRNCLLDPNEDDGDETWPYDNADGILDRGLAQYFTCFSAVRNVIVEGEERVNLNDADANEMVSEIPGINKQQADSIVEHRKNNEFANIVELLDVELVQEGQEGQGFEGNQQNNQNSGGPGGNRPGGRGGRSGINRPPVGPGRNEGSGGTRDGRPAGENSNRGGGADRSNRNQDGQQSQGTGQKAFDEAAFRSIADHVTVSDDEVMRGMVNVNTAPVEVLACLQGLDEAVAAEIVTYRETSELRSLADLLDVQGISVEVLKQISEHVSVRSDVFRVRSFGVLGRPGEVELQNPAYAGISVVVDRTEDTIKLRSWRELR